MSFGTVILSDQHSIALENRAYREQLLKRSDHFYADFVEPRVSPRSPAEDSVLDFLCLYDQLMVSEKRFDLLPLNKISDHSLIQRRPDQVRETILWLTRPSRRDEKPPVVPAHLGLSQSQFEQIRSNALWEAQSLVTLEVASVLDDARTLFESERVTDGHIENDLQLSHLSILGYLKANAFWIVELLDKWCKGGGYNHLIDDEDLKEAKLPKEVRWQFAFYSKSRRFEYYFRHLQESYAHAFESSFIGQVYEVEQSYLRDPFFQQSSRTETSIAEISKVIRVDLSDVVDYFPLPRTFEEAVEFKHRREMASFKSMLQEWMDAASTNANLEQRIRRDLQLANRDIKRLNQYRYLKEKPLFFGLRVVASNLPVLGTIISIIDIAEYILERRTARRTAWVATDRKH